MGPEETSAPGRAGCRQRQDAAQRRLLWDRGPGEGGAQGAEEGSAARAVVAGPRAASAVGAVEMDKNHTKGLESRSTGCLGHRRERAARGRCGAPRPAPLSPAPRPTPFSEPPYHLPARSSCTAILGSQREVEGCVQRGAAPGSAGSATSP